MPRDSLLRRTVARLVLVLSVAGCGAPTETKTAPEPNVGPAMPATGPAPAAPSGAHAPAGK
jgi:hypothetical protein